LLTAVMIMLAAGAAAVQAQETTQAQIQAELPAEPEAQAEPSDTQPVAVLTTDPAPGPGRVKELRLFGTRLTRDYIVFREIESALGREYSPELLEEGSGLLDRLDIFTDITLEATEEPDGVIIDVRLRENHPWVPGVSFQITDENGVAAGASVKFSNLFGRNIAGGARILVGGATTVNAVLTNPWIAGNHFSYLGGYTYRKRDNETVNFRESANELETQVQAWLGEDGRIGGRLDFIGIGADKDGVTLGDDRKDTVIEPAFFFGNDSRDRASDTATGWWNEVEVRRVQNVRAGVGYWQLTLDARRFVPLADRHTIALFSVTRVRTGTSGVDIAPWQYFYTGGTNSVRGWPLGSLVGKNEMINTVEYRYTILKPRGWKLPFNVRYRGGLHVAAFADVGTNWDRREEFSMDRTIAGAGIGARLLVPFVGMLRLDFAMGRTTTVTVNISAFEKPVMTRRRVR
jgi:outer membrane protein insertion porin family